MPVALRGPCLSGLARHRCGAWLHNHTSIQQWWGPLRTDSLHFSELATASLFALKHGGGACSVTALGNCSTRGAAACRKRQYESNGRKDELARSHDFDHWHHSGPPGSTGCAAGKRHLIHVSHVAGPLGLMTTNAATGPDCCGGFFCWAGAAAVATTITMQAVPAMEPSLLIRPPLVRLTGDDIARRKLTDPLRR